eukprot:TRINITY_DN14864_c0_g1_i1.p1 TRINITY_DN14864_c0_g1~~TRINITY_DN14864_c0_g1_i1.p1  ORF type:complete len:311 (-),score=68.60 TRINITY_DN14864_c0_g1_i1:98-964(-)
MGYVPLKAILDKIVRHHASDQFRDFKSIIIAMLETYSYENDTLITVNHMLEEDMHSAFRSYVSRRLRGLGPKRSRCHASNRNIYRPDGTGASDEVLMFDCGHAYFKSALEQEKMLVCVKCDGDSPQASAQLRRRAATSSLGIEENVSNSNDGAGNEVGEDGLRRRPVQRAADADTYMKRIAGFVVKEGAGVAIKTDLHSQSSVSSSAAAQSRLALLANLNVHRGELYSPGGLSSRPPPLPVKRRKKHLRPRQAGQLGFDVPALHSTKQLSDAQHEGIFSAWNQPTGLR